jgi:hypothetical protein
MRPDGEPITERADAQLELAERLRWELVVIAKDLLSNGRLTAKEREAAQNIVDLFDWVAPAQNITDSPPF